MKNFYYIAKNTFTECVREPIYFLLLLTAVCMIGLFPSCTLFVFREQLKLVADSAMATTIVFGLIASVLCASHTISREMRNGTVLLLMSKPVHRYSFILSKIAGIACALFVFVFICNVCTLLSLRVAKDQFQLNFTALYIYFALLLISAAAGAFRNYVYRGSFASFATLSMTVLYTGYLAYMHFFVPLQDDLLESPVYGHIAPALLLLFFAVFVMTSMTVALSSRLDMVPNLAICMILFLLGLVSNYFLAKGGGVLFGTLYALFPNWQSFWMADAVASGQKIPLEYILYTALYTFLYGAFWALWAVYLFSGREIAKDAR